MHLELALTQTLYSSCACARASFGMSESYAAEAPSWLDLASRCSAWWPFVAKFSRLGRPCFARSRRSIMWIPEARNPENARPDTGELLHTTHSQ